MVDLLTFQQLTDTKSSPQDYISTALSCLHSSGVILDFTGLLPQYKSNIVMNPKWLVGIFAEVISNKHEPCFNTGNNSTTANKKNSNNNNTINQHNSSAGLITVDELTERWKQRQLKQDHIALLLELLTTFNFGIKHPSLLNTFIIPELLPNTISEDSLLWWNATHCGKELIGRSYKFDFLPFGTFNKIVIEICKEFTSSVRMWKYGMCLAVKQEAFLKLELLQQNMATVNNNSNKDSITSKPTSSLQVHSMIPAFDITIELLVCGPKCSQVLLQIDNIISYKMKQWYPSLLSGGLLTRSVHYSAPTMVLPRPIGSKLYSECEIDVLAGRMIYASDQLTFIPSAVVLPEFFCVSVSSSIINPTASLSKVELVCSEMFTTHSKQTHTFEGAHNTVFNIIFVFSR